MKKKLYNANGHIRLDLIKKALKEAKREGNLPNVQSSDIPHFIKSLEEEIKDNPKVGKQINTREMKFLFERMMDNNHDKITDKELDIIGEIILDKDFEIG